MPHASFDHDTVVNAAPTRSAIAAALPESERGGFLRSAYSEFFTEKTYWTGADITAGHWARAYIQNQAALDLASVGVGTLRNVITAARHQEDASGAFLLTGLTPDDEWMLATLFGRSTFSPGILLLLENRNAWRLSEVWQETDPSFREMGDAMNIFAAPASWKAAGDFETLMYQALRCPPNHREAIRTLAAARRIEPGARFEEAAALRSRYSLAELEEVAGRGLALEYALA